MTTIKTLPLDPGYEIRIVDPFVPPQQIGARIDEIWAQEKQRLGEALTNGPVFFLHDYRPDCLTLQAGEYRHVLARRRAPELAEAGLAVRSVGVTGVLVCADGLVLGRRGDGVASDVGLWEPAPAGGLDRADPAEQILEELREEVGIEKSAVELPEVRGLVEDTASGVVDIVFRLHTTASAEDIRAAQKSLGTDEYSELAIIDKAEVAAFLETERDHLLPALRPMLRLAAPYPESPRQ